MREVVVVRMLEYHDAMVVVAIFLFRYGRPSGFEQGAGGRGGDVVAVDTTVDREGIAAVPARKSRVLWRTSLGLLILGIAGFEDGRGLVRWLGFSGRESCRGQVSVACLKFFVSLRSFGRESGALSKCTAPLTSLLQEALLA